MIAKDEVKHIARLANLSFSSKELEKFQKELSSILDFVSKLNEVKVEAWDVKVFKVEYSRTKSDESRPSLSITDTLVNTPRVKNNFIKTAKIFEWI